MGKLLQALLTVHSPQIAEYCIKSQSFIEAGDFFISTGKLKPKIITKFWYCDETDGPDLTKEFFINQNLRHVTALYEEYDLYRKGSDSLLCIAKKDKLNEQGQGFVRAATEEENTAINADKKKLREDFIKRLNKYWGRYQSKIHVSAFYRKR